MKVTFCMPGKRFKVLASSTSKSLLKSSIGYIVYPESLFRSKNGKTNGVRALDRVKLYVTRRGKKGKQRLELTDVMVPTVFKDGMFPAMFGGGYTNLFVDDTPEDVTTIEPIDFLAWGASVDIYLSYSSRRFPHLFAYNDIGGAYNSPTQKFYKVKQRFDMGNTDALEPFENPIFRQEFIFELRQKEQLLKVEINRHIDTFNNIFKSSLEDLGHKMAAKKIKGRFPPEVRALLDLVKRDGQDKVLKMLKMSNT